MEKSSPSLLSVSRLWCGTLFLRHHVVRANGPRKGDSDGLHQAPADHEHGLHLLRDLDRDFELHWSDVRERASYVSASAPLFVEVTHTALTVNTTRSGAVAIAHLLAFVYCL